MAPKKEKPFLPQVLTANTLTDGEVVYLTPEGTWSLDISTAVVYTDKAGAAQGEDLAAASVEKEEVIDPYLFVVDNQGGAIAPASTREKIRAKGPTIRTDLGKQAA